MWSVEEGEALLWLHGVREKEQAGFQKRHHTHHIQLIPWEHPLQECWEFPPHCCVVKFCYGSKLKGRIQKSPRWAWWLANERGTISTVSILLLEWVGQEHHLASKLMQPLPGPELKQSTVINFACIPLSTMKCHSVGRPPGEWAFMQVQEKWEAKLACCKVWGFFAMGYHLSRWTLLAKRRSKHVPVGDASHWLTFFSLFVFQLLAVIRGRSSLRLRGTGGCCRFGI